MKLCPPHTHAHQHRDRLLLEVYSPRISAATAAMAAGNAGGADDLSLYQDLLRPSYNLELINKILDTLKTLIGKGIPSVRHVCVFFLFPFSSLFFLKVKFKVSRFCNLLLDSRRLQVLDYADKLADFFKSIRHDVDSGVLRIDDELDNVVAKLKSTFMQVFLFFFFLIVFIISTPSFLSPL